MYAEGTLLLSQ